MQRWLVKGLERGDRPRSSPGSRDFNLGAIIPPAPFSRSPLGRRLKRTLTAPAGVFKLPGEGVRFYGGLQWRGRETGTGAVIIKKCIPTRILCVSWVTSLGDKAVNCGTCRGTSLIKNSPTPLGPP